MMWRQPVFQGNKHAPGPQGSDGTRGPRKETAAKSERNQMRGRGQAESSQGRSLRPRAPGIACLAGRSLTRGLRVLIGPISGNDQTPAGPVQAAALPHP